MTAIMANKKKAELCFKQAMKHDAIEGSEAKVDEWLNKAAIAENLAVAAHESAVEI